MTEQKPFKSYPRFRARTYIVVSTPGQIVFLQEPKNVTVSEGADAFFACIYHGTTGVPVWRIANDVFVASALPPRHSYNGSGLVISNVDFSQNMNSYSCFFNVHIGGGQFMDIESTTGFLVIAGLQHYYNYI